ncbi:MAG TPA: TonB-dependent receptor, partial [Cyclobacteriaceae bacterium]|nr:TonB-dependent receptor [Cyclobacteriaceae bacterium]
NEPLYAVLDRLLEGTGLVYLIYGSSVIVITRSEDIEREYTQNYFINRRIQEKFISSFDFSGISERVFLGDTTNKNQAISEALIRGLVIDGQTGDPLPGVNVNIESARQILATDPIGQFSVLLPTGPHLFTFSYIGFEKKSCEVSLADDAKWKIELMPESIELEEVLITGAAEGSALQSPVAGIIKLTARDIRDLPLFMGEPDIIKTILTLPGVSTTGEGTTGFHVRGGNIDQNLILQDESVILNSSHALGFFSVFNPDIIREVNLYKGHIPAQYGGRIASLLDIKLKDFNQGQLTANGGIGFVTSKLSIHAPLFNHRMSILAGGRFTYSDWILRQVDDPDVSESRASFYDFNFKISQKLGKNGSIHASAGKSYDRIRFADEFGFGWDNETWSLSWSQFLQKEFTSNLDLSYGNFSNDYFKPTSIDNNRILNGLSYGKAREEFTLTKFYNHTLTFGGEGTLYITAPGRLLPYNRRSTIMPEEVSRENGLELAGFINDEYIFNSLFSVSAGLRYNYFQSLGPSTVYMYPGSSPKSIESVTDSLIFGNGEKTSSYTRIEPRISFKYSPDPVSAFKLSYNRLNQFIHLISNTSAPIPVDFWMVSNYHFKPQAAHNFSLGYFKSLRRNMWETGVDIFYRNTENIPLYRDFADIRLNEHLETEVINVNGKSYGIEYYLRKNKGKYTGLLSYTYSFSMLRTDSLYAETTINQGHWFPSYFDKPHQFNLVLDINFSKASLFSLNFSYFSGRPVTAPVSNYFIDYYRLPHYTGRNNFRIPDYHRLDVSYTVKRNIYRNKRYNDSFTISIFNLYSRENAFSVFFRRLEGSNANAFKLSVLGSAFPSFTYNFNF